MVQATETDETLDETVIIDDGETEETPPETPEEESGEVEIVLEGEEEPASKPRVSGFQKSLNRLTGQRDKAREETAKLQSQLEAKDEELKLYKMKLGQSGPPKEADFEDSEEFEAAVRKYERDQTIEAAQEAARQIVSDSQSQSTQASQEEVFQAGLRKAYDQAADLQLNDFYEAEETVTDIIGAPMLNYIVTNHEKSAAMIYHLSKNSDKARAFAEMAQDPTKAVKLAQRLTRLEDSLKIQRKTKPAPDPDETIAGGAGGGDELPPGVQVW